MALQIRDVLNRRGDLSTFVVHLTRTAGGVSAKERLESILAERRFRATTSMGWAAEQDDPADAAKQSQRVVCFSETPLEHIYSLVADIEGRQIQLEPYGVAFTKLTARRLGINPIWYVDMTPGQTTNGRPRRRSTSSRLRRSRPGISTTSPSRSCCHCSSRWGPGRSARRSSGGSVNGGTSRTSLCHCSGPCISVRKMRSTTSSRRSPANRLTSGTGAGESS